MELVEARPPAAWESKVNDPAIRVRFWKRVSGGDNPDGCWFWTGPLSRLGYGQFKVGRRTMYAFAHRFSYRLHNPTGPMPECVCHRCDTPACVNPAHLWAGAHKDNIQDCIAKGRRRNRRGGYRKACKELVAVCRDAIKACSSNDDCANLPPEILERMEAAISSTRALSAGGVA